MKGRPILYVFCLVEKHKVLIPNSRYYIIELKFDRSAQEALDQINEKGYALPFTAGRREVIKIGVNFSTSSRTISEWDVGK